MSSLYPHYRPRTRYRPRDCSSYSLRLSDFPAGAWSSKNITWSARVTMQLRVRGTLDHGWFDDTPDVLERQALAVRADGVFGLKHVASGRMQQIPLKPLGIGRSLMWRCPSCRRGCRVLWSRRFFDETMYCADCIGLLYTCQSRGHTKHIDAARMLEQKMLADPCNPMVDDWMAQFKEHVEHVNYVQNVRMMSGLSTCRVLPADMRRDLQSTLARLRV